MFPYLSLWILGYSIVAFIVSVIVPIPYGKFSKSALPLQIDPRVAMGLQHGLVLLGLIFGWFEQGRFHMKLPHTNKGWVALTFLVLHFIWRGIMSQVVLTKHGTKQTSILLPVVGLLFFVPVGMNFRKMCHEIDEDYEAIDTIPIVLSFICLVLNAIVEILYDQWRSDEANCYAFDVPTRKYYGNYLRPEFLKERFVLFRYGINTPNYTFEILEWLFFTLFVFKYEAFWWFISTCLFLLSRSAWTAHWVDEVQKLWKSNKNNKYNYSF
tara:strand:+ start:104 stop:907 length:804 start_codon:yes stop_codon:yes gene_type:complete